MHTLNYRAFMLNQKKCVFRMSETSSMDISLSEMSIGPYRIPSEGTPRSKRAEEQLRSERFSGLSEFQRKIYQ